MKIGVIGHSGIVGGAAYSAFSNTGLPVVGVSLENMEDYPKLADCHVIFICVPTPQDDNGSADLSTVYDAIERIPANGQILVMKSTVYPGTNSYLAATYPQFTHISSPEFLTEANAKQDFVMPDRVVIGSWDMEAARTVEDTYRVAVRCERFIHVTPAEAEIGKYACNTFLPTKVILANQFKAIAEHLCADWDHIAEIVGSDRRIGPSHLKVTDKGGYGGLCFPKDVNAILRFAETIGCDPTVIRAVKEANDKIRGQNG